jgi:uncharacterized protein HemY
LAHVDAGAHVVTHTPDAAITDPGTELVAAENSYYAGKFAEALVEAERAIHLGMDNPRPAHLVAAKAACQLGEADAAHRHAKQLMESGRQTVGTICQQHGIELEHRNLEDLGSRHRRRQGD